MFQYVEKLKVKILSVSGKFLPAKSITDVGMVLLFGYLRAEGSLTGSCIFLMERVVLWVKTALCPRMLGSEESPALRAPVNA